MQPQPEGGTLRDAFASFKKQMGRPHPEDRAPTDPPVTLLYLWQWFHQLSSSRPLGGMGTPMPIPQSEIDAWCRLHDVKLAHWELDALSALDGLFLRSLNKSEEEVSDER